MSFWKFAKGRSARALFASTAIISHLTVPVLRTGAHAGCDGASTADEEFSFASAALPPALARRSMKLIFRNLRLAADRTSPHRTTYYCVVQWRFS